MKAIDNRKLGIMGGGQLSLMLAQAASSLGYAPTVYLSSSEEPAFSAAKSTFIGPMNDPAKLREFLAGMDVVVFENEFLGPEFMDAARATSDVSFFPDIDAIFACSDKLIQKKVLNRLGVPTARYELMPSGVSPSDWLAKIRSEFSNGYVLKWARLGYDGYGVLIQKQNSFGSDSAAIEFIERAKAKNVSIFCEELIPFTRELAVVASRSVAGDIVFYPIVQTTQKRGCCSEVEGPLEVESTLKSAVQQYVAAIGEAMALVGTYAVEFFESQNGMVYVNEIAPRVHNSGHYSQDASEASQFENHWRAVLGLPLGSTESKPYFGMLNLLGPDEYEGRALPPDFEGDFFKVHWYNKQLSKPGRKLGHINYFSHTKSEFEKKRDAAKEFSQLWNERQRTHR